jgi:hypothetical protein
MNEYRLRQDKPQILKLNNFSKRHFKGVEKGGKNEALMVRERRQKFDTNSSLTSKLPKFIKRAKVKKEKRKRDGQKGGKCLLS